jgi:hypothetical protein
MSKSDEQKIIKNALEFPGLLTSDELNFVMRMARLPSRVRLSARQIKWLYAIGRNRLEMTLADPQPEPVIDYRARACA